MQIQELIENFELLDDWEDKYRYLIDLGEKLPAFPQQFRTEEWKISGCQSQVWLVPDFSQENKITFLGDSDASIVKGLMFVVLCIFGNQSPQVIKDIDVTDIFAKIGLEEHLSPSRRNGLNAMVAKIKEYAQNR
ncbi:MAG: SufE family protein [Alphaproteobacteria bacterium]|nr:SufE family protein [Alphaproteobacteria bacterium]